MTKTNDKESTPVKIEEFKAEKIFSTEKALEFSKWLLGFDAIWTAVKEQDEEDREEWRKQISKKKGGKRRLAPQECPEEPESMTFEEFYRLSLSLAEYIYRLSAGDKSITESKNLKAHSSITNSDCWGQSAFVVDPHDLAKIYYKVKDEVGNTLVKKVAKMLHKITRVRLISRVNDERIVTSSMIVCDFEVTPSLENMNTDGMSDLDIYSKFERFAPASMGLMAFSYLIDSIKDHFDEFYEGRKWREVNGKFIKVKE